MTKEQFISQFIAASDLPPDQARLQALDAWEGYQMVVAGEPAEPVEIDEVPAAEQPAQDLYVGAPAEVAGSGDRPPRLPDVVERGRRFPVPAGQPGDRPLRAPTRLGESPELLKLENVPAQPMGDDELEQQLNEIRSIVDDPESYIGGGAYLRTEEGVEDLLPVEISDPAEQFKIQTTPVDDRIAAVPFKTPKVVYGSLAWDSLMSDARAKIRDQKADDLDLPKDHKKVSAATEREMAKLMRVGTASSPIIAPWSAEEGFAFGATMARQSTKMDASAIRERREEDVYESIEAIRADDDSFAPDWWEQLKQTVAGTIDEAEVLAADLTAAPTYLMRAVDDLLPGDWRIEDHLPSAGDILLATPGAAPLAIAARAYNEGLIRESPLVALEGELHGEDRLEKIDNGELSVEEVLRQDVEAIPEKSLQLYHSEFQNAARMLKEGDVDGAILALDRMPVSDSPTIGLATALEYSNPGRSLEDNLAEWSKKSPVVEAARDTLDFADESLDRLLGDEDFTLPDAPDWVNLVGSMVLNLKAGGAKALGADPEDPSLKLLFGGTKAFQDIAGSEAWNALAAQAEAAANAGEADTLYAELIGLSLNEMPWNGLGISQPDLALAKEGATDGDGTGEFIRQMEDGASDEELQKILNNTPLSQLPPEVRESWQAANFPDYAAAPVLLSWKQKRDDTYGGMVEKVGELVQSATTDKVLDNYGSPIAVENTAGVFMRGAGFISQGLIETGVLGVEAGLQWATDNSYETARRHVEWADSPVELTGQVLGEWWTRTLAHSSAHPNARPGLFFALGDMYLAGGGSANDDEYFALRTLGLMGDFVLPFEEFAAARVAYPFRAVRRGRALAKEVPGAPLSTKVGFGVSPKAFGLSQRLQGRDIPFLDVQTIVSDIAMQVVERNLDVGARKADGSLDPTKGLSRTMADQVDDVIRTAGVSPEEMKASLDRASLESSLGYASTILERLEGANDPLQMRQGQEYKRVRQQLEEAIRQAPKIDEQMPRSKVNKSALGRVLDAAFNRKINQVDVAMAMLEIQAARKWAADASQGVATNVDDFFKGIEYRYEGPAAEPSVEGMMPPSPIYKAMGLVEDVEDVGGAPAVLYQKGDRSKPPSVWKKISKAWQDRFIPAVEGTGLPETLTVKTGITDFDEDLFIPAKREPAEAADEIDRIDALRDLVPNPFESDEAWGTFMAHMTGQEDVMKMPPKVREYMLDPGALAAKIGSATAEQIDAAKDGIRLVEEFGSRYASGEASVTTTASLLFWSMLSRGTETVLQESAYLFLLDAGLEKYIHAAAEGKWTPELSAEYQQWLVDEVKPRSQADLDKANAKARAEFPEKERKRKAEHRLKEKARAEKYRDSVKAKKAKYRADEKSRKALHREKEKDRKALHREKEKARKSAAQQAGKTYRPKEFRPRDYRPRKPPTIKPFERNEFVPKEFVPKKHEVTDPEVLASWDEADMDARARQIGGARQNMGDAAVRFFEVMSEVVKDGPYAGKSTLALVHEWLLDPSLSGTEIRRRFFTTVGTGAQVDIKIFSFMLLTAGRMDVLILDRLQVAHLWDAVGRKDEYKTSSLYDGTTKPGSDPKSFRKGQERAWSTSSGLAGALTGTRALALYEAIEDAMIPAIGEAYRMVGRAEDGNVGTFHWETWVIDSAQEVGHPSLQALINVEKGLANPARGVPVRVGKYNRADYGASWMLDGQGDSVYYVENSKGSVYRMTAEEYTPFRDQLTPVVNAALKDGIDVSISNNKERPWHKHKEVDASEFDALVAKHGREVSFEEAVRDDAARGTRLADDPAGAGDAGAGDAGVRGPGEGGVEAVGAEAPRAGLGGEVPRDRVGEEQGPPPVEFTETADYEAFEAAKSNSTRRENLAPKGLAEFEKSRVFLSSDEKVGFVVDPQGDLQNVFNNGGPKGAGKEAVIRAIEAHGARTLDCYDGYLPTYYSRFGFEEVARMKFVDEYAPEGWDFETKGRPDVVFMAYVGGDRATIRERFTRFGYEKTDNYTTDWDGAQETARNRADDAELSPAPSVSRAAREMGLDMAESETGTSRLAVTAVRDARHQATGLWNELTKMVNDYNAMLNAPPGTRGVSKRSLQRHRSAIRRKREELYESFEAQVDEALEGLEVKVHERGGGQYAYEDKATGGVEVSSIEENIYIEVDGPRNLVQARMAALSHALNQEGLLLRHVNGEIDLSDVADKGVVDALTGADGRLATARVTLPTAATANVLGAVEQSLKQSLTGASLHPLWRRKGTTEIELVHVPEWGAPLDPADFHKVVVSVQALMEKFYEGQLGDVRVSWWDEDVFVVKEDRRPNGTDVAGRDEGPAAPDAEGVLREAGDGDLAAGRPAVAEEGLEAERGGPVREDSGDAVEPEATEDRGLRYSDLVRRASDDPYVQRVASELLPPGVDEPLYQRGEGLTRDEFVEKYTNWDPDALVMAGEGAGVESYVSRQVSSGKTTQIDSFDPGLIKEGQPEDLGDGRVMMSGRPGTYTIYEDWGPAEYGSGFSGKRVGRLVVGESGVEHLALSPELRGKGLAHMLLERAEADGYDVTKADLRTEGFNKTLHDYLTDRGRPAYQRDEGTIKGQFQVDRKTGRYIITLFEDADFTTLWHENGHLARFLLEDQGPSAMKAFTKAFDSEVGADGVRVLTREGEEQAARAFEAYLGTDSAPNGYVLVLFEQIKNALMEFWDRLRGIRRKGQNPEITAMFDQYLGYTRSVEHQARSVARDLRFRHEYNRLTVEPTKRERREAETKRVVAQAKEATRIDLDKDRVLSKLKLTDEVTEVNPYELYMDAVRYVAAETSKRIASEKTIVLTRNSVVPVTRLKAVERAVKEKLAPLFDSAEQSVGGPFGSRRWRKRMEEAGAELDGDKIKLTQAAQDRLRTLANQLVHDPVIRQKLNPDWLNPEKPVSTISIRDFNSLVEGVIDSEAGFGTARTRYAQDIPVGAIEAAHNAFKNGYRAVFAGAKEPGSLVNSVRDLVKTRRSLETEEGALVNPPVQEAMDRASRALQDIPGWFRKTGKRARRTRFGWRSRTDIMDVLHHNLHEQLALPYEPAFLEFLYKLQNDVFKDGAGFEVLRKNLGEISTALSYRRRHSQPAIELLMMEYIETIGRRADQEQLSWVDDVDAPSKFKLTDTEMEMVRDAASVLEDAVRQRINAAEQRADVIFKCFSGIKRDVALKPDQVRALYRAFHDGDWDEIADIMVKRGLATGTKVDEIPKFSRDAALTQAIVRMRAMQILDDMWKELAEVGVNLKFSEWIPSEKDAPYGADIALFKERVLEHLKEISEWQDWVVYAEEVPGAPEVIAGPRRGGVEAEDVGTRKEQERILTKRGDIERVAHLKEDTKAIGYTAMDVAAREVAMDLYQQTGFKTSQMDWVEVSLPDGSTALMPEIMKNELDKALDRATGPLGTAYDKGLVPGDSSKEVRTTKVKARLLTGKAIDAMMKLIPNMPHHIRMGITTGFFWTVNAAYYVSSTLGASLQMYQAVGGKRAMASTFGEPMMTASVVAGLFGDGVRVPYSKPIVDRFGRIYTVDEVVRLSTAEGLNTSALKTETATSLAQDINKMTANVLNPLRAWWFSNKLLVESATALDNYFRVGVFIDQLKSGKAPNQASEVARNAMLDYNDLTDAEKTVARNAVMFYSYIRKNLDLTWDTMLKNPSRILGQVRVVRGLKKEFFKDEPEIVDNEWTQMKLPVYFANMAMTDYRYSGVMFTVPPLPYQDSFGLLFELYDTATQLAESGFGTGTTRARDAAITKLAARLTPWVQYPLVALTGFEPFMGRELQDVVVPNSFIAIDEFANNGSMRRFFGARPVPIDYRERDRAASPHQGFEWKITSKEGQLKWWAFKSLWPYPISPSLLDEEGEWRVGVDVHTPGTRMQDTVQAGDRVGITDHVVKAARLYAGGGEPEGWQSTIETHRLPFTRVGEDEDGNAIYDTETHRPWLSPWMEALAFVGVKPTRIQSAEYAAQQAQQDLVRAAEEKVAE